MDIVKFVCFKVSRVAFLTDPDDPYPILASGSWDEPRNRLCIWAYRTSYDPHNDPVLLTSVDHVGDVMDIKCNTTFNYMAVGSSTGAVTLYRPTTPPDDDSYASIRLSELAHWPPTSGGSQDGLLSQGCSAIALRDADTMVVVGEEGRMVCVRLGEGQGDSTVVCSVQDCCPINGVEFVDEHTLASVNSLGQLKLWDLRTKLKAATRSIQVCSDPVSLHCLSRHPGQPHLVVTGGAGGLAFLWDLRENNFPVATLPTAGGHVWAAQFHPSAPQHLFLATETAGLLQVTSKSYDSSWSLSGGPDSKLGMTSLLPTSKSSMGINSIALTKDMVVVGTDDEMLYTIPAGLRNL